MGPLGMTEVFFILLLALLLFGPRKLPELGRLLGRGLSEFRRASNDLQATVKEEMRTYEEDVNTGKEPRLTRPSRPAAKPPGDA